MLAILMCGLAVAADVEPPASKTAPQLLLVTLRGDQLVHRVTVIRYVPVQKTVTVNVNGKLEARTVTENVAEQRTEEHAIDLKKATVRTAGGKKLDLDAVKKRLEKPQVVVLSADGKAVHEAYLKVLNREALVVTPEVAKK
jgi:hypothetical protein